jgi:regulator-associated protein of mTOR
MSKLQNGSTTSSTLNNIPSLSTTQTSQTPRIRDSIHLAACGRNELLPMHPDLPMDLFTACLTTPIKAALHWYVSQKNLCQLLPGLTIDLLEKIPGQISDRRTMMGELNWIFTAITDTIAWNVLDSELFQKLFRQDLLVASLFRNFLLAERIMKSLDCNPVSHPALPSTHEHPLWQSWDLALDMCISQLPHIVNNDHRDFVSCGFFTEQIEIFDVWLRYNVNSHRPPEQLPVVLQVLLSQQHRLKALELLGKFLDFGPWAVSAALSVGIFPYVLKLLTTQPKELRPLLTFIWAKILAVDKSCQTELIKDNGHAYFIQVLADPSVDPTHKVYSVFVLSCLVDNYPSGQESAKQTSLIAMCTYLITEKNSRDYKNNLLRQWCCICLGLCWQNYPEAKWEGVRNKAHEHLIELITDPVPEVRAAAMFALGTYIGCEIGNEGTHEQNNKLFSEIVPALIKDYDIVFIVRKELIVALFNFLNQFLTQPSPASSNTSNPTNSSNPVSSGVYSAQSGLTSHGSNSSILSKNSTSSTSNSTVLNATQQNTTPQRTIRTSMSSSAISTQMNVSGLNNNSRSIIQTIDENSLPNSVANQSINKQKTLVHSTSINQGFVNSPSLTSNSHHELFTNSTSTPIPTARQTALASSLTSNGNSSNSSIINTTRIRSSQSQSQSNSTFISNTNRPIYTLFNKVWNLLIEMQHDPYPEVAELAQRVVAYFVSQSQNFDLLKRNTINQYLSSVVLINAANRNSEQSLNSTPTNDTVPSNIVSPIQIATEFVPWCCKYFLKPLLPTQPNLQLEQLLVNRPIDMYTVDFLDQHCKLLYNHKVKKRKPNEWHGQSMDEISQMKHTAYPIHCKYHPYDDLLFVVDEETIITTYDLQTKLAKGSFSNGNSLKRTFITSFKLINAQHEAMFLTGSDDRIVRLFKPDLVNFKANKLITAFTAFGDNEKKNSSKEAGLIIEWDETNEILMCAGDTGHIRVWDMNKELYKDYLTQQNSCVSSLSTHENYTVAGFGDGTIKLFDFRRANPIHLKNDSFSGNSSFSILNTSRQLSTSSSSYLSDKTDLIPQHKAFVLSVKIHKHTSKLVTASTSGDINVFDLRNMQTIHKTPHANKGEMATAVECHPFNELIAV